MASYYKLPSGMWRAQIARRGMRLSQTFQTKGAAQAWAAREEAAILDGKADKWPRKTLADAIKRYMAEVSPSKGSARSESIMLGHTLANFPDLCGKVLHTITPADITEWRNARASEVSGSTVVRYASSLRQVERLAAVFDDRFIGDAVVAFVLCFDLAPAGVGCVDVAG